MVFVTYLKGAAKHGRHCVHHRHELRSTYLEHLKQSKNLQPCQLLKLMLH